MKVPVPKLYSKFILMCEVMFSSTFQCGILHTEGIGPLSAEDDSKRNSVRSLMNNS